MVSLYSIPVIETSCDENEDFNDVINSPDPQDGYKIVLISDIYGFNKFILLFMHKGGVK